MQMIVVIVAVAVAAVTERDNWRGMQTVTTASATTRREENDRVAVVTQASRADVDVAAVAQQRDEHGV